MPQNGALVRVRMLGPVDVIADGQPRPVHGLRRKAIIATLALHEGEIVSTGRLVDVVWGKTVSAAAVNTLQSHLSFLRNALESKTVIRSRPPGYVLDLGDGDTDVQLAELLLREGTQDADPAEGARKLADALALWRGRPLADVTGLAWLEVQAERLDVLRLQVRQALFGARLAAGEHAQLVPGLEQMMTEQPLDEKIHAQLMVALYRVGRQADALAVYQRLRHTLRDELGIDPSQPLRDLETAILRQDPALAGPAPAAAAWPAVGPAAAPVSAIARAPAQLPLAAAVTVPAQLPPAVAGFAGRGPELANLDALLPGIAQAEGTQVGPPGAVVISVLSGTAGVGKTALAVHWAHKVAALFPDGQLYVNLRGFDASGPPVDPAEAVRGFLDAFGVAVERIPRGLAAQAALYRSLLAGRRVLVVLDNARDAEQVRPLLPGSPGCMAIVTSRSQLTGLVAIDGARPLTLDLLTTAEAMDLLTSRLGQPRMASDPDAVETVVERCAGLPLALTIVTARAATRPGFPLAVIASELSQATSVLDPFRGSDAATDARAVFSWSYQELRPPAARLFRLLGLHRSPDASIAAAASLAAILPGRASELLAELAEAHLLSEHSPGRYGLHDLLRAYAAELVQARESPETRATAVRRVLEHYLHTSYNATAAMEPHLSLPALVAPQRGVIVGKPATADDAAAWFAAEQDALLAAVQFAATAGPCVPSWQLAWMLTSFLLRRGLRLVEAPGCRSSRATMHSGPAWLAGPAKALTNIGSSHALLTDYQQAVAACQQSLAIVQQAGARGWEAVVWCSLGYIHCRLGDHEQATACYQRSAELSRERAELYSEAAALGRLCDVHESAGDTAAARQAWAHALRLPDGIGHLGGAEQWPRLHPCPAKAVFGASATV